MSGTNERATIRVEWIVTAGAAFVLLVFAVPVITSRGDRDAHGQILHRIERAAEERIALIRAQAVALGRPPVVIIDGERIHLVDGYPEAQDLPKLLSGLDELDVELHGTVLHVHVPTAHDPEHCMFVYRRGARPGMPATVTSDDSGC